MSVGSVRASPSSSHAERPAQVVGVDEQGHDERPLRGDRQRPGDLKAPEVGVQQDLTDRRQGDPESLSDRRCVAFGGVSMSALLRMTVATPSSRGGVGGSAGAARGHGRLEQQDVRTGLGRVQGHDRPTVRA